MTRPPTTWLPAAVTAIVAGLSVVLSQPPVGILPSAFLAPALLLTAVALRPDLAGRLGLLAGLAAYLPMIPWLIEPAGVVAWMLLSLIQALSLGLFALLVRPVITRVWVIPVAVVAWVGIDAWRGLVPLGGFGWGSLAYAHVEGSWMLPVARVLGQHGLTLLTVLVGAFLYDVGRRVAVSTDVDESASTRLRAGLPSAQPAFLGLVATLFASVLITVEPPASDGRTLDVLAVQGNDAVTSSLPSHEEDRRILRQMAELTRAAVEEGGAPDLVVWPESSVDRDPYTSEGDDLRPLVEEAAALTDGVLLAGTNLAGPSDGTFLNAAVAVDPDGRPTDRYVKRRLVPFGEFVPWRSVLGDLPPLRQVPRDAVPGPGPQSVDVGGVAVAVAICFETLFPSLVRENVLVDDAGMLVASTNDASFGISAEPAQHLSQTQLRAVETGRWAVHAALSGASAFVDPDGGVHGRTELFTATTIRAELPLTDGRTPFLISGDVVGFAARMLVLALLLLPLASAWRRRQQAQA